RAGGRTSRGGRSSHRWFRSTGSCSERYATRARRREVAAQRVHEAREAGFARDCALAHRSRVSREVGEQRELALAAERTCVWPAGIHERGEPTRRGHATAAAGVEQLGVDPIARGEEAVLVHRLGNVLGLGEALQRLQAYEALDERRERGGVADPC